jgi:hypothetical protein
MWTTSPRKIGSMGKHRNFSEGMPYVDGPGLPQEERERARSIDNRLSLLASLLERFAAALALVDLCEAQRAATNALIADALRARKAAAADAPDGGGPAASRTMFAAIAASNDCSEFAISWIYMAARDAFIAIRDFEETLHGLRTAIRRIPTIAALVSDDAINAAITEFSREFPHAKLMRHAMAHPAYTTNKRDEHSYTGPPVNVPGIKITGDVTLHGVTISGIAGRTITVTFLHKIVSYDMTAATLQKLINVQQQIYQALRPAVGAIMQKAREQHLAQRNIP